MTAHIRCLGDLDAGPPGFASGHSRDRPADLARCAWPSLARHRRAARLSGGHGTRL